MPWQTVLPEEVRRGEARGLQSVEGADSEVSVCSAFPSRTGTLEAYEVQRNRVRILNFQNKHFYDWRPDVHILRRGFGGTQSIINDK